MKNDFLEERSEMTEPRVAASINEGGRDLARDRVRLARLRVALAELHAEQCGSMTGPIEPQQQGASAALDLALMELDERLAALEEDPT